MRAGIVPFPTEDKGHVEILKAILKGVMKTPFTEAATPPEKNSS